MKRTTKDLQRLFLNLEMLTRQYRDLSNAIYKDLGLKAAEIVVLQTLLYYPDGLSASKLCLESDRDKAQISRTLHVLENKGYITENPLDSERQRKKRWTLTGKGLEVSESMLTRSSDLYSRMADDISRLG